MAPSKGDIPWRLLRSNPRDEREEAVALARSEQQRRHEGGQESEGEGDEGGPGGRSSSELAIPWDEAALGKRLAFGAICGGVTGIAFGALSGSKVLRNNPASTQFPTSALRMKEAVRLTALSGSTFCGFMSAYMGIKYGAAVVRQESDIFNVFIASAIVAVPMVPFPALRQQFPYAAMLVAMDTINAHVL